MNFSEVLSLVRTGFIIKRAGWDENEYVYYVPTNKYKVCTKAAERIMDEDRMVKYGDYLAKYKDGWVYPWTPTQGDLFAYDWVADK